MMMQRRWWVGLFALMMVFAAGCGATKDASKGHEGHQAKQEQTGYPVKLTDDTGKTVTIKKQPKRIVSLVPSMTETIYAVGKGDKVVGVTANDDYPAKVKKLPKVGDMNINAEKVLSLKPDLVLASPMVKKETLDKLRKFGLTVIAYEPTNLKGIYKQIEGVGKAAGVEAKAEDVVAKMKKDEALAKKVAAQVPKKKRVKVWIEVSPDLYTTGQGTYMDEMVTLAGGENVAHDQKSWVKLSAEKVVKYNPDVILYTYGGKSSQIAKRGSWKSVSAVKENRIKGLDSNTTTRPGPRVTEALLDISEALYPDIYAKVAK
ncbi:iron complex transport system substrate-binding protein [Marininema mesophilum]|uniref:Iron complex transport system substrate-binding protein n=1 Tax=Marininema mesophilum TaxID=1048340 RepID=A0A1H2YZW9_9BACL|nr:ABC transporter substrate-binding protein [Marininema mesophilum]SDX10656.1 iron complex transport system substrate-binding protein [Marininema mesophilum]